MIKVKENDLGTVITLNSFVIVFGNANASEENLVQEIPTISYHRIKQTHSDIVIQALRDNVPLSIADAHWTTEKNLALRILTADCLPIMIVDQRLGYVASVHAGWRGIVNQITEKTIHEFIANGSNTEDIFVFIGPHIQAASFEIKNDIYEQLKDGVVESCGMDTHKVSLLKMISSNLKSIGIKEEQLWKSPIDTVVDMKYNSYRRDKTSRRQISFVFRN